MEILCGDGGVDDGREGGHRVGAVPRDLLAHVVDHRKPAICEGVGGFYERGSSSPHHSSKQVVCDDLLWENIANLQHRFCEKMSSSPPGLRQHAIDIKEKKKNAICRTGHWDRSKQKVMKRVIQEEGESSRWSKKPFF